MPGLGEYYRETEKLSALPKVTLLISCRANWKLNPPLTPNLVLFLLHTADTRVSSNPYILEASQSGRVHPQTPGILNPRLLLH